jgi:hypothetical protein
MRSRPRRQTPVPSPSPCDPSLTQGAAPSPCTVNMCPHRTIWIRSQSPSPKMQRPTVPLVVLGVHVRTRFHQRLNQLHRAVIRGIVQRRPPAQPTCAHIAPSDSNASCFAHDAAADHTHTGPCHSRPQCSRPPLPAPSPSPCGRSGTLHPAPFGCRADKHPLESRIYNSNPYLNAS